jgi:hypothetical protein
MPLFVAVIAEKLRAFWNAVSAIFSGRPNRQAKAVPALWVADRAGR